MPRRLQVKRKRSGVLNQWRVAAVLAVLALCTSLIDKGVSLYQLKAQNQALSSEINSAVKAAFPISVLSQRAFKATSNLPS